MSLVRDLECSQKKCKSSSLLYRKPPKNGGYPTTTNIFRFYCPSKFNAREDPKQTNMILEGKQKLNIFVSYSGCKCCSMRKTK